MKVEYKSRFASIPKRSFRNSVIHLMEHNYKLVGSHGEKTELRHKG